MDITRLSYYSTGALNTSSIGGNSLVGIGYNDTRTASSLQLPITAEINTVNAEPYNGGLRLKKSGVLRYRTTGICWFGCNFYIRKNGYNISTLASTTQPNICGEVYVNAGDIISMHCSRGDENPSGITILSVFYFVG